MTRFSAAIAVLMTGAQLAAVSSAADPASENAAGEHAYSRERALHALVKAYPDFLDRVEGNELVWRDGTRMPIDDGIEGKSFDQLLNAPDIEDQFRYAYPLQRLSTSPAVNADPGRIRHEPLFTKMYGDCERRPLASALTEIVWLPKKWGGTLKVTRVNGVDRRLAAVSRELDRLPGRYDKFLAPPAGTYNCRTIAGTRRKSVHAFGAAIDLNAENAHYWRWSKPDTAGRFRYQNAIPYEIVEIFERHGFIWGGKWYHYDTMHFEYRPELIALARLR